MTGTRGDSTVTSMRASGLLDSAGPVPPVIACSNCGRTESFPMPANVPSPEPVLDRALTSGPLPRVALWLLRRLGWRVVLARPVPKRCVITVAPHTSNWDFPIGLLAKWAIGIHFRWVGKDTLFATPLRPLFLRWGGIPVNRRVSTGFIEQMAVEFERHEDFRLVIAPEGTRGHADHWKSGFYHLARAAGVPIGLAFFDYRRRCLGIGGYVDLTGDPAADMAAIAAFYADKAGCRPELQGPVRLRDADRR
jgi:1-acyl-sn-glycerol-3-phosphate acyltransferase